MILKNKQERENFINNYKAWGVWKEVPELNLKCALPAKMDTKKLQKTK